MSRSRPLQFVQLANTLKQNGLNGGFLFGAAGPRIYSFNVQNGKFLSSWPSSDPAELSVTAGKQDADFSANSQDGEPPEKKRRLSSPHTRSETSSAEFVLERPKGKRIQGGESASPTVIKLAVTNDNSRLVAVTAEDKCLRVFKIGDQGDLRQESQRPMPKRPSAIALTPDGNTIICGDKFGDVYSLPIQASESTEVKTSPTETATPKIFKPSASELTVHTQGNRLTLQNQLRTAQQAKQKAPLAFENKLILGHVSLLTDLKHVSLPAELSPSGRERHYILTSDRDEHIRVSRGLPQSHITETYCLGHVEFVSRLCVPDWKRDLLVSGGGDYFLLVWHWPQGHLLQKVDLSQPVFQFLHEELPASQTTSSPYAPIEPQILEPLSATSGSGSPTESRQIAVTGIWSMKHEYGDDSNGLGEIFVTCEGIAGVFCYQIDAAGSMAFHQTIRLAGNALDVVVLDQSQNIIVSVDLVHEPNSLQILRKLDQPSPGMVLSTFTFDTQASTWKVVIGDGFEMVSQGGFDVVIDHEDTGIESATTSIYTTESLRKRAQGDME